MAEAMTETDVIAYVRERGLTERLGGDGDLVAERMAAGNVNILFRVANPSTGGSVIIKQALPYAWRYPDFKMPTDRSRIEYEVLTLEDRYAPGRVPSVLSFDAEASILVLEDLKRHEEMRVALARGERFPLAAQHLGRFMARTLFYTSDFHLESAEKKAAVVRFMNPVLTKVQEDLVFTEPFIPHPNNRYSAPLEPLVQEVYADTALQATVMRCKERYMTAAQALLHNDLHTGSILVNQEDTRVIDPEFAFYGPMAHETGTYFAHLALAYAAFQAHAAGPAELDAFRTWVLDTMRETWEVFHAEFLAAWEQDGVAGWGSARYREEFMARLLRETAAFGATEVFRRVIGMAHVSEFWSIEDETERAKAESVAIDIARTWLAEHGGFGGIGDLVTVVAGSRVLI